MNFMDIISRIFIVLATLSAVADGWFGWHSTDFDPEDCGLYEQKAAWFEDKLDGCRRHWCWVYQWKLTCLQKKLAQCETLSATANPTKQTAQPTKQTKEPTESTAEPTESTTKPPVALPTYCVNTILPGVFAAFGCGHCCDLLGKSPDHVCADMPATDSTWSSNSGDLFASKLGENSEVIPYTCECIPTNDAAGGCIPKNDPCDYGKRFGNLKWMYWVPAPCTNCEPGKDGRAMYCCETRDP